MARVLRTPVLITLFVCSSLPIFAIAYNWTNNAGLGDFLWTTTTNWAPNGTPGNGDSVTISNGDTVKLNTLSGSTGNLVQLVVSGGSGINGTNNAGTAAAAQLLGVRTTVTLSGTGTIGATITMQATAATTFTCSISNFNALFKVSNAITVTLGGPATLAGGSIQFSLGTLTTNNFDISLGGNWSFAGATAFNVGTSTVTFSGPGAQTVDTGGFPFASLTKSGSSTLSVLNNQLTVTGTLTTSTATDVVDMGTQNFNLGALSNTGTIALDGIQPTQTITAMDTAKGTVNYYGTLAGTIPLLLHTFYNLTISGGGPRVFSLNYLATFVNNLLTITSGSTLTMGTFAGAGPNTVILTVGTAPTSGSLAVTGTLDCTGVAPTSTTGGAYLILVNGTTTINTGGDIKTGNNTLYLSDANGLGGSLVMAGGTLDFHLATNTANTTIGTGAISGTGIINASGQGTIRPQGNVTLTGLTYTPGQTRLTFAGGTSGSPLVFTPGTASVDSIRIGSGTLAVGSVVKVSGATLNLTGNVSSNGAISCGSNAGGVTSSLDVTGVTVTVGAAQAGGGDVDFTVAPGAALSTFISTGSTFIFSGTNAQALNSNSLSFNNLQVGATGALTLSASITLTGDLSNNLGGSLNTTANSTTVTFAPTGLSTAYNVLHPGLSASPAAMISGTNTFFNFTCNTVPGATLYFTSGNTTTVNNAWTIAGTSGNLVSLLSSNFGSQWTISIAGTSSVSYAYVQDSSVSGANNISPTTSTNAGNNKTAVAPRWIFSAGSLTWVGATSNNWNVASNWDLGYIPGPQDNVTISGSNPAKLFSAVSVSSILITTGTLDLSNFNLPLLTSSGAAGSFTLQAGGTLLLDGGQATLTFGSAPVLSGTVEYYGTGTTGLILGNTYVNLEFANAGTWTLNAPLSVTGTFSYPSGSPKVKLSGNNMTVGGSLTAPGTLDASGGGNVTAAGNVDFTGGTFTSGAGAFIFDGTSTLTTAGNPFSNVQIGTATVGGSLALADNLTLTGTLTFQTGGATTLNVGNVTVTLGPAALNMTNLTTFTTGGSSTFVFDGTTSLTSATKVFNNIEIGNTTTAGSLTLAGNLTLTGAITVGTFAGSVFNVGGFTVTVGGNVMLTNLVPANFTSAGSTFIFDGTSTLTTAGGTFNNIEIGNTTTAGSLTLVDNLTLTGAISIGTTAGSTFVVTNRTVTVGGNVTLTNLVPANFTSAGSTFIFDGTSTLTTAGGTFNNVQIGTATVGGSLALADNLTLTGTLTFQTGGATTLNVGNVTVTLGPAALNMTNLTTFTTGGSSTFVFDGTTSLTSATKVFNNIEIGNTTTAGSLTLVDNLTLTGAISIGTTAGSTFVVTNRTVTVGGNVTFTASLTAFTSGGSTFIFDGTTTLASTGKTFNNIQVGTATLAAAVTLGDNAALANASGVLSMTQGALDLNGHTLVLGTALNMNSATVAQITVGTGTLDGTTNGRAITISSAQATITQTAGTLKAPSLTVSNGTYTQTGALAGTVTLGTGGLTQTGGTITANVDLITSSGNVAITGGTFNQGSSTLTMDTGATTVQVLTPSQLANLTIGVAGSGAVSISTDDLTLSGNLDIISSWTFNTNALNLTVGGAATVSGTLNGSNGKLVSVTGDTTCSGTINLLNGNYTTNNMNLSGSLIASGSETITVNGGWNRNGGTFTPVTSTVQFAGAGTITGTAGTETFYNLVKSGIGTTTNFTANLVIISSLTLSSGTLQDFGAATYTITMGNQLGSPATVTWDSSGGGVFSPGAGTVYFYNQKILVNGTNTFSTFWADTTTAGHAITISFQQATTQTVNTTLHVLGTAANAVTLMSAAQALLYSVPPPNDASLTPHIAPNPPTWNQQWYISVPGAATIDWVIVQLSWASTTSITPGPNCTNDGYNDNWFFTIPVIASWTIDKNNNSRIDTLRVQVKQGTTLGGSFNGIVVKVDGYGTVSGAANFSLPAGNTDVFDVTLPEGSFEDTSATPTWQILSNTTLIGTVGGALVEHNTATSTKVYTASKGARPVITYTLAALSSTQAYIHFSELVFGNAALGASISAISFIYSGGGLTAVRPVETSGSGAHGAVITFTTPLAVNDILAGAQNIQAAPGAIWGAPASVDPAPYPNAIADKNLAPNANRSMLNATATAFGPAVQVHNISDVGIGFITPVLAEDQSIIRDPTRGGIGLVTVFDGSKWLPPQNVFLEARISPQVLGVVPVPAVTLYWDINPPSTYDFNNLWLPTGASTLWWAGYLNGDRAHPADPQATLVPSSASNAGLRDFIIQANNPAIKDGALFQFMFLLNDGAGHTLPCAFPADPANPANVRPFEYMLHSVVQQRGGVTITNNVIHPANGESAYLHYTVNAPGPVTIMVFDLSGSIVNVLQRGTQSSGEYTTAWDGKNRGGRAVARGIYFIRVVGPGFDEIRKVLVVR